MPSYAELQSQIAELERQAEKVRQEERAGAIESIHKIMRDYGLSVDELARDLSKGDGRRRAVAAKYRDPVSGATWSGRGRTPKWLAGRVKNDYSVKT